VHEDVLSVLPLDKAVALAALNHFTVPFSFICLYSFFAKNAPDPRSGPIQKRGRGWTHTPPLDLSPKRKQKSNAILLYNSVASAGLAAVGFSGLKNTGGKTAGATIAVTTFEFYRFRFHFRARDPVHFPAGKSANAGARRFWSVLRDTASPAAYARLFEPGSALGSAPSGLADWPRPFVLRAVHLDGLTIAAGGWFFVDVHVFDLRELCDNPVVYPT